ncbi:hypothetical protein E3J38_06560, partial [candidate division TA06 bacterium]
MLDFSKIKTYPISKRKSKVTVSQFGSPCQPDVAMGEFFSSLPDILAGNDFKAVVSSIVTARKEKKLVMFMLGAHVIKCGLSPILIDLLKRGIVGGFAINGGCSIHDFEIAMWGKTSEDVEAGLSDGTFGMADETGRLMNEAYEEGADQGLGMGEALGRKLLFLKAPHRDLSILAVCADLKAPITVHVCLGADIVHQHPTANGAAIGETTYYDFKKFTSLVAGLEGGVICNFGSSVVLPEVFLKALTIARNLGHPAKNFAAANFDMTEQYRPRENVVLRPSGGV